MRTIYALSVLILLCLGCESPSAIKARNSSKDEKYILSIDERAIKFVKEPNYLVKPKPGEAYASMSLKLENKTAEELTYMSMSCGWDIIYTTNNKNVTITSWPCEKNIPKLYIVGPHGVSVNNLVIHFKKLSGKLKFEIGMTLKATIDNVWRMNPTLLLSNPENLLWSNEVTTP